MRAVLIGAVESSRVAIDVIARAPGWTLPLVVTLPAELAHRHSDYVDLSGAAAAAGAGVLTARNANAPEICEAIEAAAPDYVFVIGWSQICHARLLASARLGTIGYHPAALPRMRGRAVIPWTILCDEPITAGTLFWIDSGVDTGPILAQRFFHVAPDETAETLYQRHMVALESIMEDALADLLSGTPRRDAQDERYATWAARRIPESGRIDWRMPAAAIARLIRASGRPYPGARTHVGPRRDELIVWRAQVTAAAERHLGSEGQIIARSESGLVVRCGSGSALEIMEWSGGEAEAPRLHAILGGGA